MRAKIPWTLTHGFLLEMGGLVIYQAEGSPLVVRDVSQLNTPFDVPEALIQDKNIGDTFGKFLAVAQTIWFMTQCVARWTRHLPVTELEVLTIGYAFLNSFTCMFWLSKPQNVYVALAKRTVTRAERDISAGNEKPTVTGEDDPTVNSPWFLITDIIGSEYCPGSSSRSPRSHLFYSSLQANDKWKMAVPLSPVITLFGVIHLIPIFLGSFPTPVEMWIWVVTAICITVTPILILGTKTWQQKPQFSIVPSSTTSLPVTLVMGILCLLARQALPFIALMALRSLPDTAYHNIDWVSFIPHL